MLAIKTKANLDGYSFHTNPIYMQVAKNNEILFWYHVETLARKNLFSPFFWWNFWQEAEIACCAMFWLTHCFLETFYKQLWVTIRLVFQAILMRKSCLLQDSCPMPNLLFALSTTPVTNMSREISHSLQDTMDPRKLFWIFAPKL